MTELRIRDVSRTYPDSVHALKDVSLPIPVGTSMTVRETAAAVGS